MYYKGKIMKNFWSIEIKLNNTQSKIAFRELSEIIIYNEKFYELIRLIPEAIEEIPAPNSLFLVSQDVNDNSNNREEALFKLNSIYLMLNGVLSLFYDINNGCERFKSIFEEYYPTENGFVDNKNEIPIQSDIKYQYPFSDNLDFDIDSKNNLIEVISLAIKNKELYYILMQFGFDKSWGRLYSIWDSVYYSVKSSKKANCKNKKDVMRLLTLDEDKIRALQGCANSYELLFLEARHGNQGWNIPSNVISKEDAIKLIKCIIFKYIQALEKKLI